MEKLIITAAVNGGITPRSKQPAIPHTPKEIADAVVQCSQAGASVAHIHARDDAGRPSYDQSVWREIIERIRERSDILLNLSTSGLNLPQDRPEEDAWNHLEYRPEIASFNCGSVNHGDKPFINSPALAKNSRWRTKLTRSHWRLRSTIPVSSTKPSRSSNKVTLAKN